MNILKPFALAIVATLAFTGCRLPAEHDVYAVAREAAARDSVWPEAVSFPDIDDCKLYVAKNIARIEVPLTVTTNGVDVQAIYTVWAKRIARDWRLDRASLRFVSTGDTVLSR